MSSPPAPDAATILEQASELLARGPDATALAMLAEASTRLPADAALASRHGDALQLARRFHEAEAEYRRALALDPDRFDTCYGLGTSLLQGSAYGAAREALERAVALGPDDARARVNLADALFQLGEVDLAIAQYVAVTGMEDGEASAMAARNIACILPGSPAADNAAVLALRRGWARQLPAPDPGTRRPATAAAGRKLRIGYVSSFFGSGNWMKPVYGVINRHDRDRFELHLVATGRPPSAEAGYRDHDADHVWLAQKAGDARLARDIAAAGIDVLVDLNGYSAPERLAIFTQRAAPVQLGWFNMFATTGIDAFDALIGDAAVLPPEEEAHYAERILRLPGSYLAFEVTHAAPEVVAPPCLAAGHLTFGSLCSAYKLTDQVIAAWGRILRGAPAARLLLRHAMLEEASNRAALLARLAHQGIAGDRVTLEGRAPHLDFIATYGRIDVALDTFPYNGGTTTTEALWQGVPVLSSNGDRWAARTSRSLLLAAGLGEWVARDTEDYVARAIALARDPATPARLAALRAGMRPALLASPVCDSEGLCRALEGIYLAEHAAALARG